MEQEIEEEVAERCRGESCRGAGCSRGSCWRRVGPYVMHQPGSQCKFASDSAVDPAGRVVHQVDCAQALGEEPGVDRGGDCSRV